MPTKQALDALGSMPLADRLGVFAKLKPLVESENPYAHPSVTAAQGRLKPLRKFRYGNWRIFFELDETPVLVEKYTYKGSLIVQSIRNRRSAY
ncbi:MAG: hypothetical protein AAF787_10430 [Chloroflexota bacterium]